MLWVEWGRSGALTVPLYALPSRIKFSIGTFTSQWYEKHGTKCHVIGNSALRENLKWPITFVPKVDRTDKRPASY